jgi:hypothetical protein
VLCRSLLFVINPITPLKRECCMQQPCVCHRFDTSKSNNPYHPSKSTNSWLVHPENAVYLFKQLTCSFYFPRLCLCCNQSDTARAQFSHGCACVAINSILTGLCLCCNESFTARSQVSRGCPCKTRKNLQESIPDEAKRV